MILFLMIKGKERKGKRKSRNEINVNVLIKQVGNEKRESEDIKLSFQK